MAAEPEIREYISRNSRLFEAKCNSNIGEPTSEEIRGSGLVVIVLLIPSPQLEC